MKKKFAIGDTFTYKGKRYKIYKERDKDSCVGCAFHGKDCHKFLSTENIPYCMDWECIFEECDGSEVEKTYIDLTKIFGGCPKGTKLYSPICGEVEFIKIINDTDYPIKCRSKNAGFIMFNKRGQYIEGGECMLFPSKNVRTWDNFKPKKERFDPNTLQLFDKVIVRLEDQTLWSIDFFSFVETKDVKCIGGYFNRCIPYNDETKYLIGTEDEAPEYYRYWED